MEVQIKEKGKLKKFKLINSWSDVNLETFQKLIKFHTGSKSKEALNTIAELSNIPKDLINKLEISDVETFIKNDIDKSLPEAMSILFRPIVKETSNGVYTIEAYDGETTIRAEVMKKMAAEQVQNALVFFWTFVSVLLEILQSYLKEQKQAKKKQ